MKILGIDPGTELVGFGVIDVAGGRETFHDCGVIRTPRTLKVEERLSVVRKDMQEIIDNYKPEVCGLESLFFFRNITTAFGVSQARGVIMQVLEENKIQVIEVAPTEVKKSITGFGRADKKQIQEMVCLLLNLDFVPQPDDAADGLAIALTCARKTALDRMQK